MLVTGNHDGTFCLSSLVGAAPTDHAVVQTGSSWILSLDFSRDGKTLVLGHGSGMVTLWDLTGPAPTERFAHKGHTAAVHTIALAPTGLLASGSHDGTIRLWDLTEGARERFSFPCKGMVPWNAL